MNDVTTLLQLAAEDAPPPAFDLDDVVARGRRVHHRRRALAGGGLALALVAGVSAGAIAVTRDPGTNAVTPARPAAEAEPGVPDRLTGDNAARTIADLLGVSFREVTVHERDPMPSGAPAVSLSAAIADARGDSSLSFHMMPAGTAPAAKPGRMRPTCDGSYFGNPGDGPPDEAYVGTCSTRTLGDGSVLLVRDGRAPGGYARAQAMLVRPDDSGMAVESTNQDTVDPKTCVETAFEKRCPVGPITRTDPGVTGDRLGDLLVALEPASR